MKDRWLWVSVFFAALVYGIVVSPQCQRGKMAVESELSEATP